MKLPLVTPSTKLGTWEDQKMPSVYVPSIRRTDSGKVTYNHIPCPARFLGICFEHVFLNEVKVLARWNAMKYEEQCQLVVSHKMDGI